MTNLSKLLASVLLAFGLIATANANATNNDISIDQFAVYQSDTPTTTDSEESKEGEEGEEGKKKKEGEEEPDC